MAKNAQEKVLDRKLIAVYDKYGLDTFLEVCKEMLVVKDSENVRKKQLVNGEVCEVVLRVMTEHYLTMNKRQGRVFHSMVLKNKRDPKSEFRTELDFTLLTSSFCATGECKSFAGQVKVVDDCTLVRDDLKADVAKQTQVHYRALMPYLEDYVKPGINLTQPILRTFCFVFSRGFVEDKRTPKAKAILPVIFPSTLFRYYDGLFSKYRRGVYDVEKAGKKFQAMANSRVLHIQHAGYLGY